MQFAQVWLVHNIPPLNTLQTNYWHFCPVKTFFSLAITCDDLPDPQYGSVTLTGNRVGAYANYECDFGFQLSGDSQRVCLSSGAWSGEAPTCVRKSVIASYQQRAWEKMVKIRSSKINDRGTMGIYICDTLVHYVYWGTIQGMYMSFGIPWVRNNAGDSDTLGM